MKRSLVAVYCSEDEKKSIERLAKRDGRSVSNLLLMLLRQYIEEQEEKRE